MRNIRTHYLATTAFLALSGAAYAADMAVKAPPVAPAPPPITWTGFYVGAQIGGASFDPSCNTVATPFNLFPFSALPCTPEESAVLSSSSLSSASVIGGGKVGYDWQWNKVVLGVVGEFDWTDLNSTSQIVSFSDGPTGQSAATTSEKIDWLASVRGRLGWAFDSLLVYGTGGVAWTRIKIGPTSLSGTCCADWAEPGLSTTKTGAVAGGGFEYRVTQNVSVVGELLWYGFGPTSESKFCATCFSTVVSGVPTTYTTSFKSQDIVSGKLGVNWRF